MKRNWFVFMVTVICFVGFCSVSDVMGQRPIGMVTGSETGTYIQFGKNIAEIAKDVGLHINVKTSKGSLDNIRRLASTENAAFAIVQSDVLGYLKRSQDAKSKSDAKKLRLIFPFYNEEVHLFARKEIKQFQDLEGKRVVIGNPGSGNAVTATNLLKLMNVHPREKITNLETPLDAVMAVFKKEADAMFYVAGKPVKLFKKMQGLDTKLINQVHFVPLNDPKMLAEDYVASSISTEHYSWFPNSISTIAVKALLISYDFSRGNTWYYRQRCGQLSKLSRILKKKIKWLQNNGHPKWNEVDLDEDIGSWEPDRCSRPDFVAIPSVRSTPPPDTNPYWEGIRIQIEGK